MARRSAPVVARGAGTGLSGGAIPVEGGIMVTGSHNPPEYDGFKVACGKSTLFGKEVQAIADIIEARRFVSGRNSRAKCYSAVGELKSISANWQCCQRRIRSN